jgi:hypothetical protein
MNALANARRTAERLAAGDERELARMLDHLLICKGCEDDLAVIFTDGEQLCAGCASEFDRMNDEANRVCCAYCDREAAPAYSALAIPVCRTHSEHALAAADDLRIAGRRWASRARAFEPTPNNRERAG